MMVAAAIVYPVLDEEAEDAEDEGVGDGLAPSSKSVVAAGGGDSGGEMVAYDCDINRWASCIESRGHTDGLWKK